MDIETLATEGYVSVEYPSVLRECVDDAMASWKKFCAVPIEEKLRLAGGDRKNDFGYMFRNDSGPRADRKEQFHVNRRQIEDLRERAQRIADRTVTAFINDIDVLIMATHATVLDFARSVEQKYGLLDFAEHVENSSDRWTFRYLHYLGGKMLANAHADRGGFTLHMSETHEGGEYLDFSGKWRAWPVSRSRTIIFPGMGLQKRCPELNALWHRVVSTPETIREGRYSMVGFIDFGSEFVYNGSKRLQDMPQGFNYGMSAEELNTFFAA